MPAVPNVPGVPPLTSYLGGIVTALTSDLISSIFGIAPVWGIFLDGAPVVVADSIISFDYSQDFLVSDYPTEQGGFQSYNKVQVPLKVKIRFATGGSVSDRTSLLDQIDTIIGDTNLYDAVTPEAIYQNVNATHQDYRRTANQGLGLLTVDVNFQEIRSSASTTFSNTQQPNGADQTNTGSVQAGSSTAPPSNIQ